MAITIDLSADLAGIGQRIGNATGSGTIALGRAVAGGDVNGDGIADIVVGAPGYDSGSSNIGGVFVIFGGIAAFNSEIDVGTLGDAGIAILGANSADSAGNNIAAGDFNNDGFADIALSAIGYDGVADNAGATFVVFGDDSLPDSVDLGSLGALGTRIDPEAGVSKIGTRNLAFAGDFFDDGTGDLIAGTFIDGLGQTNSGAAFLLDGDGLGGNVALPSFDGVVLYDDPDGAIFGSAVAGGGDVNGDGIDDVLVAAGTGGVGQQGIVYVVFGGPAPASPFEVSDPTVLGTRGLRIFGESPGDKIGTVAIVGDVNGDGIDDFVIGARERDDNGTASGAAYLVFGATDLGTGVSLTGLGSDGVKITGGETLDNIGEQVSAAGDFNGDGLDDFLIAAPGDDDNGDRAGAVYVVFGSAGFGATLDLDALSDAQGVKVLGAAASNQIGANSIAGAGDVNEDGLDDILIGGGGTTDAAYVVFGFADTPGGGIVRTGGDGVDQFFVGGGPDTLSGGGGDDLLAGGAGDDSVDGGEGNDRLWGQSGADTLQGGAGDDSIRGNPGDDSIVGGDGDDDVRGHPGDDEIFGDLGFDLLFGGADGDTISGGIGDDTINGNSGGDIIDGGGGGDTLRGQGGNDVIFGGAGDDGILGMQGADSLFGGDGDDALTPGPGDDELTGGEGDDVFLFGLNQGSNTVTDFIPGEDVVLAPAVLGRFDQESIVDTPDGVRITFEQVPTTAIILAGVTVDQLGPLDVMIS